LPRVQPRAAAVAGDGGLDNQRHHPDDSNFPRDRVQEHTQRGPGDCCDCRAEGPLSKSDS
jgi:hypothetical protein